MIYFDNAATSGHKPQSVINAMNFALKNLCANPGRSGHTLSKDAAIRVYNAREKTAEFFGCEGAENVVFTANCTTSINFVLKGLLEAGDHIIVSDLEHNAVMRPIKSMNIDFSVANVSLENDDDTVNNFKNAIKHNTKMIFCTAASNICGKILPLKKLGDLCKEKRILFAVDAAQAAGVIPINMQEMNIDYLCVAAHKGLYCPMGLGILVARGDIKNTIIEGGTGTDSINFIQPSTLPEMLESGTINLPAIFTVGAGIDFVRSHSKCIMDHEKNLVKRLCNGLKNSNIIFYTKSYNNDYVPVICFNMPNIASETFAEFLSKNGFALRAGLHCAPLAHKKFNTQKHGAVRFSPSIFNTTREVDMLVDTIKKFKNY